jgi:lysophospholipase L1-like esterase
MEAFYEKGNWFDGVHPTKKGAVLFSRWLAERFLEPEFSQIKNPAS